MTIVEILLALVLAAQAVAVLYLLNIGRRLESEVSVLKYHAAVAQEAVDESAGRLAAVDPEPVKAPHPVPASARLDAEAAAAFGGTMSPLRIEKGEVVRRQNLLWRATGGTQIAPGMEVRRTE